MTGYYDYVLCFIPLALFGVTALLGVAGVAWTSAVPLGAGIAVLAVGHALFVNGPVDSSTGASQTQARRSGPTPINAD